MQQVMMIVPIDRHINKAENVAEKDRDQAAERLPVSSARHLQFQHHDRDDDGDDAIAECGQPIPSHGSMPFGGGHRIIAQGRFCWQVRPISLGVLPLTAGRGSRG
jgi:hypothetical protein